MGIKIAQTLRAVRGERKAKMKLGRVLQRPQEEPRDGAEHSACKKPLQQFSFDLLNRQQLFKTNAQCLGNSLTRTAATHNPTKHSLGTRENQV